MMIGALTAGNQQSLNAASQSTLPEGIPLEAGTSSVGKNISIATGAIDDSVALLFRGLEPR